MNNNFSKIFEYDDFKITLRLLNREAEDHVNIKNEF